MKRDSVLDHQSVKKNWQKEALHIKRTLGQLGFGLIKMFLFLLALGGISFSFISGYQFLSSSSCFSLRNIVVSGVRDNLRQEVIKISGITASDSLLSLDTATIRRNIQKHVWIKSVSVKKQFPHTLYIKLQKEEPIALVLIDRMYLMDTEGVVFKDVDRDDPIDLPVITGLSIDGKNSNGDLRRVASFLNTYSSMNAMLPVKKLSEVHMETDGALSLYFNKLPFKVFLGRDDFGRKIRSLQDIVRHLRVTHRLYQARSIDLDYSDRGVVAFSGRVV